MLFSQQFDGMTEAHAFRSHHPLDHISTAAARPQTVPQIFLRADHQARRVVFVEGTEPDQVRAVPHELHTTRFGQSFEGYLPLQPFDLLLRDPRHPPSFPRKPVK